MTNDHRYLDEMRKHHAGGKVTIYRNRDWILQALDDGITKRAIFNKLVAHEGLTIGYQAFAKHTQKLIAIRDRKDPQAAKTLKQGATGKAATREGSHTPSETEMTEIKRYVHNPVPDLDELI